MSAQKDIHVKVDKEFHEEFLDALKKLRWKTQSSYFQYAMRELIKEAESRPTNRSKDIHRNEKRSKK